MTDERDALPEIPEITPEQRRRFNEDWKLLGIEPGETVFIIKPSFTLDDVKEALFGSTYTSPRTITVVLGVPLQVVLTGTRQVYNSFEYRSKDKPVGVQYNVPHWVFDGWLLKSGFDPYEEVVRVRLVFQADSDDGTYDIYFQRVPTNPNPEEEIVFENYGW